MRKRQSGMVLFVALVLLLILSMIGVTVARMQTVEERMARNEDNRQLAHQAAEAALRNAEASLGNAPPISTFCNNTGGYYCLNQSAGTSQIPSLNWSAAANVATYSGPALSAPEQSPKIAMEFIGQTAAPGDNLSGPPPTYRVTVQGLNADGTPSVLLQSIYR
jgi:type IV pilus assembly protein PilX